MKKPPTQDRGVELKSERLKGKRIALAVCGGIACLETVKLARELRRHGATIQAYITPAAKLFIQPLSLEWATTLKVIEELGADAEHLESFDCVVVAPMTLNTLSKVALGICDNAVTQLIATSFGRKVPVVVVPTMNLAMASHPLYETYLGRIKEWGAIESPALNEEGRLKFPPIESVVETVLGAKLG